MRAVAHARGVKRERIEIATDIHIPRYFGSGGMPRLLHANFLKYLDGT